MGQAKLAEIYDPAIRAEYFREFELAVSNTIVERLAFRMDSDKLSEDHYMLDAVPGMREMVNGRQMHGLLARKFSIENKEYEDTLFVRDLDMRFGKRDLIMEKVRQHARAASRHPLELVMEKIKGAESDAAGVDGQFFFDTDHTYSGATYTTNQDNDITYDIDDGSMGVPSGEEGTTTSPSAKTVKAAVNLCIQQMIGFLDNEGRPINEGATDFLVVAPHTFKAALDEALNSRQLYAEANRLPVGALNIEGIATPLVGTGTNAWTDKLAVFRVDGGIPKPLVWQEAVPLEMDYMGLDTEQGFDQRIHRWGAYAVRGVDLGLWQGSCLVTLT